MLFASSVNTACSADAARADASSRRLAHLLAKEGLDLGRA
jgi:hypothetical protein